MWTSFLIFGKKFDCCGINLGRDFMKYVPRLHQWRTTALNYRGKFGASFGQGEGSFGYLAHMICTHVHLSN